MRGLFPEELAPSLTEEQAVSWSSDFRVNGCQLDWGDELSHRRPAEPEKRTRARAFPERSWAIRQYHAAAAPSTSTVANSDRAASLRRSIL